MLIKRKIGRIDKAKGRGEGISIRGAKEQRRSVGGMACYVAVGSRSSASSGEAKRQVGGQLHG